MGLSIRHLPSSLCKHNRTWRKRLGTKFRRIVLRDPVISILNENLVRGKVHIAPRASFPARGGAEDTQFRAPYLAQIQRISSRFSCKSSLTTIAQFLQVLPDRLVQSSHLGLLLAQRRNEPPHPLLERLVVIRGWKQEPTEATQGQLHVALERSRVLRPSGRGGCQSSFLNKNSLHPSPPPQVFSLSSRKPRSR